MRIRTTTLALALSGALAAATLFAQQGPPPGPPPGGPGADVPILTQLLELTSEQQDAWAAIRHDLGETLQPLHEQMKTIQDELRAILESDAPDACAAGEHLLAAHGVDAQIQAAVAASNAAFEALLDPEQLAKLELYREIRQLMSQPPPPPPGGPGQGQQRGR